MADVYFPAWNPEYVSSYHRYYAVHFVYVLNLLQAGGLHVAFCDAAGQRIRHKTKFELQIFGKPVIIDFSNHLDVLPEKVMKEYAAVLKFHYLPAVHGHIENMYSMTTVCFTDWERYAAMRSTIQYTARGPILCKQRPYGAAIFRRRAVQSLLKSRFGDDVDCTLEVQEQFLRKVGDCLVSVCVPGARNDILDRGQTQYMALGACTLSPRLSSRLSWNAELTPNVHYLECSSDYSDLIERIEWCQSNRERCLEIGQDAQSIFDSTSVPLRQVEWIRELLR